MFGRDDNACFVGCGVGLKREGWEGFYIGELLSYDEKSVEFVFGSCVV